jgi:hypothetical protein
MEPRGTGHEDDPAAQVQRALLINLIAELERSLWWDRVRLKASMVVHSVPILAQVTGIRGDPDEEISTLMEEIAGKERLLADYRRQLGRFTRH